MDITKLYVPNPQKWIDHYQKVGHTNHNGYIQSKNGTIRRQRGGELNSSTGAFMQAIDGKNIKDTPIHSHIPCSSNGKRKVHVLSRIIAMRN
jgi:hypothetical protein